MRKNLPVARRVLGKCHKLTLKMRCNYAMALFKDNGATLKDLRARVITLSDTARIARRVLGGAHPNTRAIEAALRTAREALRARETSSGMG